ncbi:AmmeMemoRadiSam system protein B [Desulfocurvibacter africanus]|uniref:MEMO1 family protein Desaf_3754 n=1 Tax=Desulfocurvibacter africanus subsp. africanus str. Walvis Bay TaxID=690850 RepID=F3Z001_DESAF|nr:AmmeMemoRadiSam system protein B [Desulfocurvibacter africanus]EGJ52030.1 UPF0103/Mediator of ErbB2-driven cell motility-containing protein [Desulfocurvibacter africanus subsp. africanus str. Walvis Bay]
MNRRPVVAGQFYPGQADQLESMVGEYLSKAGAKAQERTILAMTPHAGYVFSGSVAGQTLGRANLAKTVLLLGPNHTGMGSRFAVWSDGIWELPGGGLNVNEGLAKAIIKADARLVADQTAHAREHSLEVVLPFLRAIDPETTIVPIAVAEPRLEVLLEVGAAIGRVLASWKHPVSMVVSSDMSHYVTHEEAKRWDSMALEPILALNPSEAYRVVRESGISMCGIMPMTVGLTAAESLEASKAELVAYATSGETSGDYTQVVGYAGVLVS